MKECVQWSDSSLQPPLKEGSDPSAHKQGHRTKQRLPSSRDPELRPPGVPRLHREPCLREAFLRAGPPLSGPEGQANLPELESGELRETGVLSDFKPRKPGL